MQLREEDGLLEGSAVLHYVVQYHRDSKAEASLTRIQGISPLQYCDLLVLPAQYRILATYRIQRR